MFESLEQRKLFSIGVVNGVLTVNGTTANETIYAAWKQTSATTWSVKLNDGSQTQEWNYSGNNSWGSVSLYGGNGNDTVSIGGTVSGYTNTYNPPVPVSANGGAGADTVWGAEEDDTLFGGSGNDSLYGQGGDDVLQGDGGIDQMYGGSGADTFYAGNDSQASDTSYGGNGFDTYYLESHLDPVTGNETAIDYYSPSSTDSVADQIIKTYV